MALGRYAWREGATSLWRGRRAGAVAMAAITAVVFVAGAVPGDRVRAEIGKSKKAYAEALSHKGPSLVDIVTDPMALSIPPKITSDQGFGFATAMSRIVLNGGAGEAVAMGRSNLRNIPRSW